MEAGIIAMIQNYRNFISRLGTLDTIRAKHIEELEFRVCSFKLYDLKILSIFVGWFILLCFSFVAFLLKVMYKISIPENRTL